MSESEVCIGKRLALLRKVVEMSQDELAARYGVSHTTLRRYERGEVAIPATFILAVFDLAEKAKPGAFSLEWILLGIDPRPPVLPTMDALPPGKGTVETLPRIPLKARSAESDDVLAEQQLQAAESVHKTACESRRPFVLLKPQLFADGNTWCALYGENLQEGVAGFGDTPDAAAVAFDRAWRTQRTPGTLLRKRA